MSFVNGFIDAIGFNDRLYKNNKRTLLIKSILSKKVQNNIHRIFRENEYDTNWKSKYKESYPTTIFLSNLLTAMVLISFGEYLYKLNTGSKKDFKP